MMHTFGLAIITAVSVGLCSYLAALGHNIGKAKRSGFNYVVVPCDPHSMFWLLTNQFLVPLIKRLPSSLWDSWLGVMIPDFSFKSGFQMFRRHGETSLVVSWTRIHLRTANAELNHQVALRRQEFPKCRPAYRIVLQYGENVITANGDVWKAHHKSMASSFNERNLELVFYEVIKQTMGMIASWKDGSGRLKERLATVKDDLSRLSFNTIAFVGFGLRVPWPGQDLVPEQNGTELARYGSLETPPGYHRCLVDTMVILMHHIVKLMLTPKLLFPLLFFSAPACEAYTTHRDFVKYLDEMVATKMEEAKKRSGRSTQGMDLLGRLVRTAQSNRKRGSNREGIEGQEEEVGMPGAMGLSWDEMVGNVFIMFVAGYDTVSNVSHSMLIQLAANPRAQRLLQKEVDHLLGATDPKRWQYEKLIGPMLSGMMVDCMDETMRITPPVNELPRQTSLTAGTTVKVAGHERVIPSGTVVILSGKPVQSNPRYWPRAASRDRLGGGDDDDDDDDLEQFDPGRWRRGLEPSAPASPGGPGKRSGGQAEGGPRKRFQPEPGAFLPFSDGPRSCVGRRMAQVEMAALLAVIFREYSLELDVDEWATEAEVKGMGEEEKRELYRKAQAKSWWCIKQVKTTVAASLPDDRLVPLRLVPRGEERFVSWIDAETAGGGEEG